MTILDLHHAPARALARRTHPAWPAWAAAALLLLIMGLPALVAPESQLAPESWRGNSASYTVQP
ncbi:hypothetical protein M4578_17610 [Salipiger sp. P9]|uniref:hypothetical protein n=1 Tax=Salipiger pentaromativorans TaxID=2943193 RepID=UPI00215850AD|nr:hypothetical protein [Salipiger pentaromativorans]MCR8549651.1 hypothetical protein [Salipiger pentaromativorans]